MTRLWRIVAVGLAAATPSVAQPAGPLVGWGTNTSGQLNFPSGEFFKAVSGDFSNTAAIREDGTIGMWGDFWGGLGTPPPTGRFTMLDGGRDSFVAIRENGTLAAWGINAHGGLNVPSGTFKHAAAGSNAYAAVRTDGTLAGWGVLSTLTPPAGNDFVAVTAGEGSALALRADGTVVGWGANFWGELAVPPGTYRDVAITYGWAAGVRSDGSLIYWGALRPPSMGALIGPFTQIDMGTSGSSPLGLREDGSLATSSGQVATGTFVAIGTGDSHYLAIVPPPSSLIFVGAWAGWVVGRRRRAV
ncbi:MAG: hypothetical protein JNM80_10060 [Phycisphaerae bacterium]|nr:hypothetical protein [Phycisphaerae bacterium]